MNASTGIIPGSTNAKLVAAGVAVFAGIIILFALNAKYKFLPASMNLFQKLGLSKSEDGSFWTDPNSKTTLSLTQTQMPPNFPSRFGYSMMFDLMIFNSRASISVATGGALPYRHIFHRGSNDLGTAGTPAGCAGGGSAATGSTAASTGLPKLMNPGFIADPATNDVIVFIDTSSGRESARITNHKLATPYRIGIIVYEGFFEIYTECRLLTTQVLKGIPLSVASSGVYALAGPHALSAKIQNLRLWSTTLPVQQVITECSTPMAPFGSAPPCAPTVASIKAATASVMGTSSSPTSSSTTIASSLQCPPPN